MIQRWWITLKIYICWDYFFFLFMIQQLLLGLMLLIWNSCNVFFSVFTIQVIIWLIGDVQYIFTSAILFPSNELISNIFPSFMHILSQWLFLWFCIIVYTYIHYHVPEYIHFLCIYLNFNYRYFFLTFLINFVKPTCIWKHANIVLLASYYQKM